MKRRDFLEKVTGATAAIQLAPLAVLAGTQHDTKTEKDMYAGAKRIAPPRYLQERFEQLLLDLQQNEWSTYLKLLFGVDLTLNNLQLDRELAKILPNITEKRGFEDFAGIRMIEPGRPSMSLLYYALASPRVTPEISGESFVDSQYLGWEDLSFLEDYIYSLLDLNIDDEILAREYVLAVFAYEFRPAYKTPDGSPYADFVYSRTGISRIGQHPYNYDKSKRSFTNLPAEASPKEIAVMPAKYALFLAKVTKTSDTNLMSKERGDVRRLSVFKTERDFLVPIRKIFNNDPLINGAKITFYEAHVNEKLARLAKFDGIELFSDQHTKYVLTKPPFNKRSATTDEGETVSDHNASMVKLVRNGLSATVLLSPINEELMQIAKQDGKIACFKVPRKKDLLLNIDSNRRYTSLKLQSYAYKNASNYVATEGYAKKYRATRFGAPRNAPLFANIRHKVEVTDLQSINHLDGDYPGFHTMINDGNYYTAMFEDNICDGCITAEIKETIPSSVMQQMARNIFPAFSLVTAPDFFPFAESFDLEDFDKNKTSSFMEGGVENLSWCRLRANPNIIDPISNSPAFPEFENSAKEKGNALPRTMHAVLTLKIKPTNSDYDLKTKKYRKTKDRDYISSSYMTDTASFVFAPGWDATYSANDKTRPFLATIGLGSPFPEDMKLCAAANGMWPVASPDAARTFQGSLKPLVSLGVTPCALPLTDLEIGIHKSHPMLKEPNTSLQDCHGWDGEHGPFLNKYKNRFCVEFTDIGRADYVHNLMNPDIGFNMELLRELAPKEIIFRMETLRKCKTTLEGTKHEFSKLWLVSAEAVNWDKGAIGMGIPLALVGGSRNWAISPQDNIRGNGFLYVFVDPQYEHKFAPSDYDWVTSRRRRLQIYNIFVCQLSADAISYCRISPEGNPSKVIWKNG